jgi:hypothetical protein
MRIPSRKSRKTFSLSRDAVAYLETYRARRKEPSLSGVVEAIIRERREEEEADKLAAQTRAYYDSVTPAELKETEAWGEFVESEIADSEA